MYTWLTRITKLIDRSHVLFHGIIVFLPEDNPLL
jgi:hypothetical protein